MPAPGGGKCPHGHGWPILIGDRSYFDFAQSGNAEDWEIDQSQLAPLTQR
jgi:hypothetical protein